MRLRSELSVDEEEEAAAAAIATRHAHDEKTKALH